MNDDDYKRPDLHSGIPETLTELHNTICQTFGIVRDFCIQFMNPDVSNKFIKVTSTGPIYNQVKPRFHRAVQSGLVKYAIICVQHC